MKFQKLFLICRQITCCWVFLAFAMGAQAQSLKGMPSLPKGGVGLRGSIGIGFADFKTLTHDTDYKLDRGTYFATSIEKGFDVLNLYLTFGLNYMSARGVANYNYTTLSSATNYSLSEVEFESKTYEGTLGFKLKLIDDYWFRPYIEGGGMGSYHELRYGSKIAQLNATGDDYKDRETLMGSGYYYEGGLELEFSEKFGLKLAARQTTAQTKKIETLGNRPFRIESQIYYLSALFGF